MFASLPSYSPVFVFSSSFLHAIALSYRALGGRWIPSLAGIHELYYWCTYVCVCGREIRKFAYSSLYIRPSVYRERDTPTYLAATSSWHRSALQMKLVLEPIHDTCVSVYSFAAFLAAWNAFARIRKVACTTISAMSYEPKISEPPNEVYGFAH